jgi:mono/diheme cytochrome c family protein
MIRLLLLLFCFACSAHAAELKISPDLLSKLQQATIDIDDPVYNKHKRYAGYWLSDVLNAAGITADPNTVWVFTALDGYKARIGAADVIRSKARAFLAVKDLDAPEGWEKLQQGKELISPAPYYLIWQTPADMPKDIKLPWPYQLAAISVLNADEAQEKLWPQGDKSPSVIRGFKIFKQNCISCHSLNLEGGLIGPELNVPKNILEYRNRKLLKEFIKNPSAFRARDKMPSFNAILPDQSIDDMLDYLNWMEKHKILPETNK